MLVGTRFDCCHSAAARLKREREGGRREERGREGGRREGGRRDRENNREKLFLNGCSLVYPKKITIVWIFCNRLQLKPACFGFWYIKYLTIFT